MSISLVSTVKFYIYELFFYSIRLKIYIAILFMIKVFLLTILVFFQNKSSESLRFLNKNFCFILLIQTQNTWNQICFIKSEIKLIINFLNFCRVLFTNNNLLIVWIAIFNLKSKLVLCYASTN